MSLSQITFVASENSFRNEFVVVNASLVNWLTRGIKTVCN